MRLRSRSGKQETGPTPEELAQIAFEKMKEHLEERQTTTSDPEKLPEVLMVGTEQGKEEEEFGTGLNSKRKEDNKIVLSSSLDPGPLPDPYFDTSRSITSLVHDEQDKQKEEETVLTSGRFVYKSKRALQRERKAERAKFAGPNWFNMPAPEMTPEIKNDLKIIQIRNSLDRSHYYKSSDWKKSLPKYFQMATVVEGPADYYSARIPKRQRRKTMVEELLSDKSFRKYHTNKYKELQNKRRQQGLKRKRLGKKQTR